MSYNYKNGWHDTLLKAEYIKEADHMKKETKPKTKRKTSRTDQMAIPPVPSFEIGREYRSDKTNNSIVIKAIEGATVIFEERTRYTKDGPAKTIVFTMAGDSFKDFMREVYDV